MRERSLGRLGQSQNSADNQSVDLMKFEISGLERQIETLIGECRRLNSENRSLKSEHKALMSERTELKEKNRLARTRLEKIVVKLKALEDEQ